LSVINCSKCNQNKFFLNSFRKPSEKSSLACNEINMRKKAKTKK
jgi:hypothetical protein